MTPPAPRSGGVVATVLVLALWLGAAIYFAVAVAPAAFRVLPTRTLAGALVGGTLPAIFVSGIVALLIAALLAWRDPAGAPGRSVRLAASLLAAALCAVAQFGVDPRIERLRASLGGALEGASVGDPARAAFGRLHALSVGLLGLAMVLAIVVLVVASRHLLTRPPE
ncbi:MAG TPA: DUF4149 domain-containing protein [Gemmatimonadaceae bacterium]